MRVLVCSVPGSGHIYPLLPLALHMAQEGDEVLWATGPDHTAELARHGFATATAGPPMGVWWQQLAARTRGRPGDGVPPARTTHWFAPRLFGEVGAPLMIDELLKHARKLRPDVVLFESRCYAAAAVARAASALPVLQAVTMLFSPEVEELVSDAVTPMWRQLGLETPTRAGVFDGLTFSAFPASLDDPPSYGGLEVHRLAWAASSPAPPPWLGRWIEEQAGREIVYATLGTVFHGNLAVLRAIVEGALAVDAAVLLTVGPGGDPAALGPLPPRARAERFVPQDAVLPACAAVVSHGGSGTMLGALAHALPHVLVPQGADQFINAERCAAIGVGRALLPPRVTADEVGAALEAVLADPGYRVRAARVRGEMERGLLPEDARALIQERLAAR